jgi:putative ABC transport system substrate-binding protein
MKSRWCLFSRIAGNLFAVILTANVSAPHKSQASDRPFRIGIVLPGEHFSGAVEGLKQGMKALGHVDGRDISYVLEDSGGNRAKTIALTKKLLADRVNLIYTVTNTTLAAVGPLAAPSRTPVVFGSAAGPVESGLLPAYATPDTHITGVTSGSIELTEKRLEVLRDIFPRIKKTAIFVDIGAESSVAAANVARQAAPRLGFTLIERAVKSKEESIESAKSLTLRDVEILLLLPGLSNTNAIAELAAIAREKHLPLAAYQMEHVRDHGALLSYGSSYFLQGKQAARLVSRIVRGVPVHQLPIERPESYELILNLDTARAIGVKFSTVILNRADAIFRKGSRD